MNAFSRVPAQLRWLALLVVLLGAASQALAAKTYSDNGDGTVTDPTTGLIWMRCSMGQTWTGSTCTGTASYYTWDQANALTGTVNFAGLSDWRLPNIRELQTIVDRSVYNPAIDVTAFPNTPTWHFWSASAFAYDSSYPWGVSFSYGYNDSTDKYSNLQVRLVRAGQPFGLLDIARPNTDYVDQGNGTVSHTPTGLMWQRCAVGQTWTGSTCSGTASAFTWDAAKLLTSTFAGQSDWRLPTEEELISLVDYSRSWLAFNTALFPNAPTSYFWSASAYANGSSDAWSVGFFAGYADYRVKGDTYQVRLVRAGQSLGPLTLTVNLKGNGYGFISSDPVGILCDTHGNPFFGFALCSASYASGTQVTLSASPDKGSIFTGWSGACSGKGSCVVAMNSDQSVTATFKRIDLTPILMLLLD